MAKTPTDLFSFAQKCESFNLRLESSLTKRRGNAIWCIARYGTSKKFPAKVLRQAFDHAQQYANELGQDVRIVMEAGLKEEHGGDDVLKAIVTIKPSSLSSQTLICLPMPPCTMCKEKATHKFVALYQSRIESKTSIVEYGCSEHIERIRSYWA